MDAFLIWLEQTSFSTWVRESGSLWGYPTILFMHTLGLATVSGLNSGINLRLLGFGRRVPLGSLAPFVRVIWVAFAVTAISGTALLVADATTKMRSPIFYVKMLFVVLALANLHLITKGVFRNPRIDTAALPDNVKILAITSLLFWILATTAGRLMAYLGPVGGLF